MVDVVYKIVCEAFLKNTLTMFEQEKLVIETRLRGFKAPLSI